MDVVVRDFLRREFPINNAFLRRLFAPVDSASLAYFRIVFGIIMLWEIGLRFTIVQDFYIAPSFHFTYYGFDWVRPWPGVGMYAHLAVLGVLAAFITMGFLYRISAALFFVGITYVFLLDKALYLNHLYLICLVSFLMIFVPAHRFFSIDAWRIPAIRSDIAPAWALWAIRAQVGFVYFFGGIAKLNADWLRGEPLSLWLSWKTDFPLIGSFFTEEWMAMFFAYGGLLLDLLVVPFLLWRKTRWFAFAVAVFFNVMNANLFTIAIFPWFMIAGTAMFFPPDWPRRLIQRLRRTESTLWRSEVPPVVPLGPIGLLAFGVLGLFFVIQVLLPFRHYLYPGNVNWTEEGHRFAWRMMLRHKESEVKFFATDTISNRTWQIKLLDYLTPNQVRKMATRPDMILQFSHYLNDELRDEGYEAIEIRADVKTALNGREPQPLVDPTVDLTDEPYNLLPASWIVPLEEPLPPRLDRLARNQRRGVSTIAASSRSLDESLSDVAKYEEAISRDSDDIVAYNNQGNAYMNLGEFDRAIENYNDVIRLDPNNIAALNNRASAYASLGQFERALDDLNRAIGVDSENAAFYNNRGGIYMIMEQFERAVEDYGEAISLNPNYTDAYANRARANTRLGRHGLALTDFERAVALGADPERLFREIESDRELK